MASFTHRLQLLLLFQTLCHFINVAIAEPVQYCRFGHDDGEVDFCMGVTMHQNCSSSSYDMYLSLSVTRDSALGWTAIGSGPVMDGTLMFIVYGDPLAQDQDPIVSIRTVNGHHQPHLVTQREIYPVDLRVLQATWVRDEEVEHSTAAHDNSRYTAKIALVCYACSQWPGSSSISALSSSQPWIWAWNKQMEFDVFSYDAHLDMHAHHAGNGGWGTFFIDMARSISHDEGYPSLPPLRPDVSSLGASDSPIGASGLLASLRANPIARLHGLVMMLAFLLFFPLGIVAIRSGSTKAFKYHWVIQAVATFFVGIGAVLGVAMSGGLSHLFASTHQTLGTTLVFLLLVQAVAGWRHHVVFVRIRRRTWWSTMHVWLGRLNALGGGGVVISGLSFAGAGRASVAMVAVIVVIDVLAVWGWVWRARIQAQNQATAAAKMAESSEPGLEPEVQWRDGVNKYFAVDGDDSDDESSQTTLGKDSTEKDLKVENSDDAGK